MDYQKRLDRLFKESIEEVKACNIPTGKIEKVTVNTRATKRLGQCKTRFRGTAKQTSEINISKYILEENVSDIMAKNTIIHEILHAVNDKECKGHNYKWKQYANIINRNYPCYTITRTATIQASQVFNSNIPTEIKAKYIIECPCCHKQWKYQKMVGAVKNPSNWQCGSCKEPLVRIK